MLPWFHWTIVLSFYLCTSYHLVLYAGLLLGTFSIDKQHACVLVSPLFVDEMLVPLSLELVHGLNCLWHVSVIVVLLASNIPSGLIKPTLETARRLFLSHYLGGLVYFVEFGAYSSFLQDTGQATTLWTLRFQRTCCLFLDASQVLRQVCVCYSCGLCS